MRPITFSIVAVLLVVFLNATAAHASTQDDVNQAVTIIQLESDCSSSHCSSKSTGALCQHGKRKQNGKAIWPKAADG